MRWHPDRNRDNLVEAERRFKQLGAAFAVLLDAAKRKDYDADLERSAHGGSAHGPRFEEEVDAKIAAAIFLRAMMEMASLMASAGHNRDVLLGALLSQGCPEVLARRIADDTMQSMAQAKAEQRRRAKAEAQAEAQAKVREKADRQQEGSARQKSEDAGCSVKATSSEASISVYWVLGSVIALLLGSFVIGNQQYRSEARTVSVDIPVSPTADASRTNGNQPTAAVKFFNLAVAAKSANIRKRPSAKTGIAAVASRGEPLSETGRENGFVNVEFADGRKGWISDQLVIDLGRAKALSATTATQYGVASLRSPALENYLREVAAKDYSGRVRATFSATAGDPARLNRDIQDIVLSLQLPTYIGADKDAKRWWALEAKWLSDNGTRPSDELAAATAAAQADPSDVDGLIALGMASIKAEAWDVLFSRLAYTLPLLAPSSTNTWVIVAAWAAQRGDQKLAASALSLAISKSKSPSVTNGYIANVAATASDQLVVAAFRLGANPSGGGLVTVPSTLPASTIAAGLTLAAATPTPDLNCPAMNRYAPKYEQSMASLVLAAGGPAVNTGYSSLHVELVNALCRSDRGIAIAMVKERRIDERFAEKVRRILAPSMPSLLDALSQPL